MTFNNMEILTCGSHLPRALRRKASPSLLVKSDTHTPNPADLGSMHITTKVHEACTSHSPGYRQADTLI